MTNLLDLLKLHQSEEAGNIFLYFSYFEFSSQPTMSSRNDQIPDYPGFTRLFLPMDCYPIEFREFIVTLPWWRRWCELFFLPFSPSSAFSPMDFSYSGGIIVLSAGHQKQSLLKSQYHINHYQCLNSFQHQPTDLP